MSRPRVAILASGAGSTAEAFIHASAQGRINPTVELVISNNKNAGVFDVVNRLNQRYGLHIKTHNISGATHPAAPDERVRPGDQTKAEEQALLDILRAGTYDLVALMGYMKRVGEHLVHEFGWRSEYAHPHLARLLNTHPGLLPETKGLYGIHVQQHVLDEGLSHGGQTLHVVAAEYDEGPVIARHKVAVKPGDTAETLFDRVKIAEKRHLPYDIAAFLEQSRAKV